MNSPRWKGSLRRAGFRVPPISRVRFLDRLWIIVATTCCTDLSFALCRTGCQPVPRELRGWLNPYYPRKRQIFPAISTLPIAVEEAEMRKMPHVRSNTAPRRGYSRCCTADAIQIAGGEDSSFRPRRCTFRCPSFFIFRQRAYPQGPASWQHWSKRPFAKRLGVFPKIPQSLAISPCTYADSRPASATAIKIESLVCGKIFWRLCHFCHC